jgi:hypothetical protein
MSRIPQRDPTRFFSVVGPAYVAERHGDPVNPFVADPPVRKGDIVASWLVLGTLIAAILIFAGEITVFAGAGLSSGIVATAIE